MKRLYVPEGTIEQLRGANVNFMEMNPSKIVIHMHLICPGTGVHYFVFGVVERNGQRCFVSNVVGGKYVLPHGGIVNNIDDVLEGDFFGGEIPFSVQDFQPTEWGKIESQHQRHHIWQ